MVQLLLFYTGEVVPNTIYLLGCCLFPNNHLHKPSCRLPMYPRSDWVPVNETSLRRNFTSSVLKRTLKRCVGCVRQHCSTEVHSGWISSNTSSFRKGYRNRFESTARHQTTPAVLLMHCNRRGDALEQCICISVYRSWTLHSFPSSAGTFVPRSWSWSMMIWEALCVALFQ